MKITKSQLKQLVKEAMTDHWDNRDKIAMAGAIEGGPTNAQEWQGWGRSFGLAPEYDEDSQLIFYISRDSRDPNRAAAEAVRAGASVDRDNDGNDVIYTGVYNKAPVARPVAESKKITKTQLQRIIQEEINSINEVALAPAIFQQMKAAGNLPAGATIDFKLGQGGKQQQKQASGPVNKIAIVQALASKIGKQAAQLIISKLDDQTLTTLNMMLAKA